MIKQNASIDGQNKLFKRRTKDLKLIQSYNYKKWA